MCHIMHNLTCDIMGNFSTFLDLGIFFGIQDTNDLNSLISLLANRIAKPWYLGRFQNCRKIEKIC